MNTEIKKISQEFVSKELLLKTQMEQYKIEMDLRREESGKKFLLKLVESYGFNVGDRVETIEEEKYFDKEKGERVKGKFSGKIKTIYLKENIIHEIKQRSGYTSPMITNDVNERRSYLIPEYIRYQEQYPKNDELENGVCLMYFLEFDDENIGYKKQWYSHDFMSHRGLSDVFKKIKDYEKE